MEVPWGAGAGTLDIIQREQNRNFMGRNLLTESEKKYLSVWKKVNNLYQKTETVVSTK